MEVFTGILNMQTSHPSFQYFWRCKSTRLSHLFFADDVLLFAEATTPSLTWLKAGIDTFSRWSGLHPNLHKSEIYFSGVPPDSRSTFMSLFGFQEGSLPFWYLGIPIISSRLRKDDCITLVNIITSRVQSWTQRFLSFAGRLQLIRSVLHSVQVYWANVFIIPRAVLDKIEQILWQFLWKGLGLGAGGAKVAWSNVCLPKSEGGLGIRKLRESNTAAMLKHIWLLFTDKESLWCRWIHSVFLKNVNFWLASKPTVCSWSWKKIFDLRGDFRRSFCWRVGDGTLVSFWFDNWHPKGPLNLLFSNTEIYRSRLPKGASVADFLAFPEHTSGVLNDIAAWDDPLPELNYEPDRFLWLGNPSGTFSAASAWEAIRPRSQKLRWAPFIWNKALIP